MDKDRRFCSAEAVASYLNPSQDASRRASDALSQGTQEMRKVVLRFRGTPEQSGGRAAEHFHAATFNASAIRKYRPVRATVQPVAGPHAAGPDIVVTAGTAKRLEAQIKYYQNASKTRMALSRSDYRGMQKVVPADQVERIRADAARLAEGSGPKSFDHSDTAQNVTNRLCVDGVESKPLAKNEAIALARDPRPLARAGVVSELTDAAVGGAIIGAAVGGLTSAAQNFMAYYQGEKDAETALQDIGKDAGKGGFVGVVVATTATTARLGLRAVGLETAAMSNLPLALAMSAVDAGSAIAQDVSAVTRGELPTEELVPRAKRHVGRAATRGVTGLAGMELGAEVGTAVLPGVGTLLGAAAGGVAGLALADRTIKQALDDSPLWILVFIAFFILGVILIIRAIRGFATLPAVN